MGTLISTGGVMATKMSKAERQWQAEEDARIIARYAELKADKTRYRAAIAAIKAQRDSLDRLQSREGKS